jgi:hypothetical protein
VDGLPLALEQAAAYIQATGATLASYRLLFRERQADLLARGEATGHPAHVAATLGLALSQLADEAAAAAGLLRVLAFLAPEPVPVSLLFIDKAASLLGSEVPGIVHMALRESRCSAAGEPVRRWRVSRYSVAG